MRNERVGVTEETRLARGREARLLARQDRNRFRCVVLLLALMLAGGGTRLRGADPTAGFQFFASPNAHNLYLLSDDGKLFRWGEPRYGDQVSSPALPVVPYFENVIAVPPSPSGAKWVHASGYDRHELFLDEDGRLFHSLASLDQVTQFTEIPPPPPSGAPWRKVANFGEGTVLLNSAGELFKLGLYSLVNYLDQNPGAPINSPTPWIQTMPKPQAIGAIRELTSSSGVLLVLTEEGEIFGYSGNYPQTIVGSELVAGSLWYRVVRPTGVNRWLSFSARGSAAVAFGDDGELYYWGERIPTSVTVGLGTDGRVPTKLHRPTGSPYNVSAWESAVVIGTSVIMVSREGGVYAFGYPYPALQPMAGSGNQLVLSSATRLTHPALNESFTTVQAGADFVLVRRADGELWRWGTFMQLEGLWSLMTARAPEKLNLPVQIANPVMRLAPAARMLQPQRLERIGVDVDYELSAETFALQGDLERVDFLLNNEVMNGSVQGSGIRASMVWRPLELGDFNLSVRALDNLGFVTTSAPVPFEVVPAIRWSLSTNRVAEPVGGATPTDVQLKIARTGPVNQELNFRFSIFPGRLRGLDYRVEGALLFDGAGDQFEVRIAPGQAEALVRIVPLADQFTDPELTIWISRVYDSTELRNHLLPATDLRLTIVDATPLDGVNPITIVDNPASRFGFAGGSVPITVSVLKSLTTQPGVSLSFAPGDGWPYARHLHSEELPDRTLLYYQVENLSAGPHTLTASVYDIASQWWERRRLSSPWQIQIWDASTLPRAWVNAAAYTVNEADETILPVTVSRDGSLDAPAEVALYFSGTALNGSDFDAPAATVTIPAGSASAQFSVRFRNDNRPEIDELLIITAGQVLCEALAGCVVANGNSAARFTILDDDRPVEPPETGARVFAHHEGNASYLLTASGQLYSWGENLNNQLGLGQVPAELAGAVPWPRRNRSLPNGQKWSQFVPGPTLGFGVTSSNTVLAWGVGFGLEYASFGLPEPRQVSGVPAGFSPRLTVGGSLYSPLPSGRLQAHRFDQYPPNRMYPYGDPGVDFVDLSTQAAVLASDGMFYRWSGPYGFRREQIPLLAGAGYWRDLAFSESEMVALDELGRLFNVRSLGSTYDPALGYTRAIYNTNPRPALPGNRSVAQLYGNQTQLLALATDGAAFRLLTTGSNDLNAAAEMIPFPMGVTKWTSLAAGARHFVAVGDDGFVYAWGENARGQLGNGSVEPAAAPLQLPAFVGVNDPAREFPISNLVLPPVPRFHGMPASLGLDGPGTVRVTARAYDPDGFVERVEILLNGELAALATFNPTRLAFGAELYFSDPGDFVLTVRAWDDSGLSADSAALLVRVSDPGRYPVVKVWNIPSAGAEGYGAPGTFIISRQGIAKVPLTVYFDIYGTATEGVDYPALPRSVVIPAGAAEVRLPVIARPDFIVEPTEEVNLTILNPGCDPDTAPPGSGCYAIGSPATAPVYIVDYVAPGGAYLNIVWLNVLNPVASEGSTNVARVELRRQGTLLEPLSVAYELGGSAVNGVDYSPLSGTAVIPAGSDRVTLTFAAIQDFVAEPYEIAELRLSPPGCGVGGNPVPSCYEVQGVNPVVIIIGEAVVLPPLPPVQPGLSVTPRPVLFESVNHLAGQGAILRLVSEPGAKFLLLTSPDLVAWESLGELTCTSGRMEFLDVDAAPRATRFYRVVPPPGP